MENKISYSVAHAVTRAYQRYNLLLSRDDIFKIVDLIQSGECDRVKFMRRQSNYRTIWKIRYKKQDLYVVYNNRYKVIATFLTKQMYENPLRGGK